MRSIRGLDIIKDVFRWNKDSPFIRWFEESLCKMNFVNADYLSVLQTVFAILPITVLLPQLFKNSDDAQDCEGNETKGD